MPFLRTIKRSLLANKDFNKYFFYALGELVLVVAGIVIALQIDAWNSEKQEQAALDGYLNVIAKNMSEDIRQISMIGKQRGAALLASRRVLHATFWRTAPFTAAEVALASDTLEQARQQFYFNANTSGYEALKSSGRINSLKNRQIETLLYEYYQTVKRIMNAEREHNDYVKMLSLQIMADRTRSPETIFFFREPELLPEEEFRDYEPQFLSMIQDPVASALYEQTSLQALLQDYERLTSIGSWFVELAESGAGKLVEAGGNPEIYDPDSPAGYPRVLERGQIAWHTYSWDVAPPQSAFYRSLLSTTLTDEGLRFVHPGGDDWAFVYARVGSPDYFTDRLGKDLSAFNVLRLEMKGDSGGEQAVVVLKDKDDPDDGSETHVELTLTDQWQTYDIPLSEFREADPSKLHVVAGFLFSGRAQTYSVRTIRYLNTD